MRPSGILLLGTASAVLAAHPGQAQVCSSNTTTTVAAIPAAGNPTTATASLPWPEAPQVPNVRLQIVQEITGEVLGDNSAGVAAAVSPQFNPAGAGMPSTITLSMDMLKTPLGGAKLVHASWGSAQDSKTACIRIRLAAEPARHRSMTWMVNGNPIDRFPGDGKLAVADRLEARVTGEGLWKDTRLDFDPRLMEQVIATVGSARMTVDTAGMAATFPLTLRAPYQAQAARYAAQLRSDGWSEPVRLDPVLVRGGAPRFLPNPDGPGEYAVAATASAPTVTLQGINLGLAGEEAQLTVRVRAFNATDTKFDERAPLTKTLGPCALPGRQCLTLTLDRPDIAARRYEVLLTTADSQTTTYPARIRAKADVLTLSKIESGFADRSVVFAGRPATLYTTIDATASGGVPSTVRIDGEVVQNWKAALVGSSLSLTNVPIPAVGENSDRAQLVLTLEFPNGYSANGTLIAAQVPVIADTPIRIYGGREQTVTVRGRYLSEINVLPGRVVTATQVTSGTDLLSLTFGQGDAAPARESLKVRRVGQELVTIPVEVVSRPTIESAVSLGVTRTQNCPTSGGIPFGSARRLVVPAGGALCIRIAPDTSVSVGVSDSVLVKVTNEGATVGAPIAIIYNARLGVPGTLIPLPGVEPGSAVDISLTRVNQSSDARAVTSIRQRVGLLATITGAQIRLGRSSRGNDADEELIPTNVNTALNVGVGFYGRPFNNRFFTFFVGATQSTRSFCPGSARASTVNQPALFGGMSFRWIAFGFGHAVSDAKIPDSCTAPAAGTTPATVSDKGGFWLFIGPAIKLAP